MADTLRVYNLTQGVALAPHAEHARTIWARLVGLLGTRGLAAGDGLIIEPCNSVHMWGMRYPLDVIFASRELAVLGLVESLLPWRMTRIYRGARYAIELPVGVIASTGTALGDQLELRTAE